MNTLSVFIPKLLMTVTLALMTVACASSPAPRYFRLAASAEPAATAEQGASERAVIIGPFQVADYLDRPQIVTRDGANGMTVDDFERWAEPLDANFQAVVAANVGRLLGSDRVLEFPAQNILKADRRVMGRVSRFDVDAAGLAVLEVQWGVLDGAGAVSRPGGVARYEARAAGAGAAAQVAALNATVTAFSADVAAAVR
jgi:uncharacterized lipoprotein YmbA